MKISIIITIYNEEKTMKRTLDSLVNQSYEGEYEIVIVDAGSKDNTIPIIKDYIENHPNKNIRLSVEEGVSRSEGRNLGVEKAKGEIVAFIDGDCEADKNWVKTLVSKMEENNVEAVGGKCITPKEASLLQELIGYELDYRFETIKEGRVNRLPTMNLAVKKSIFQELKGLNTDLITSEDMDFGYRLNKKGYKMVYTKDAIIYHHHRTSLRDYAKQKFYSTSYVPISYLRNPSGLKGDQINSILMILQPSFFGLLLLSLISSLFLPSFSIISLGLFVLLSITFIYKTLKIYNHFKEPNTFLLFFLYWYWVFFVTLGVINGLKNLLKYKMR